MLKKIKIIGSKINDFSMLDEIEKYLLEIFGDKTNALKLNKDFMKSLKKSDQLEGEEKIFFQIKYF
jgi:hypothetical protein